MIYQWKPGNHFTGDAQIAGEALESLRQERGGLVTPPDVVEAATAPTSALHRFFEWDDATAANAYRVVQAGDLIRSIHVSVERDNQGPVTVRAFISVVEQESRHPHYSSLADALADPIYRAQVLDQAKRDLKTWRERYRELQELTDVFTAIDSQVMAA